jgi:DNA (cytosine-5)-methyltransferase 1
MPHFFWKRLTYDRHGNPLPPFPARTHGPGLKPWHCIKDALIPIGRLGSRPNNDFYHQPMPAKKPGPSYSPQSQLRACITTSGDAYHYTGTRKYTPRELSLFQSFPYGYKFHGPKTQALIQIGNAFPPIMAEAMYRTIAKTLECFDKGYIEAEEDLSELDDILERRGASLRSALALPRASFGMPQQSRGSNSRYLMHDEARSGRSMSSKSSPFARAAKEDRKPQP